MMKNAAPFKKFQFLDVVEGDSRSHQKDAEIPSKVRYTLTDVTPIKMRTLDNFIFLAGKITPQILKSRGILASAGKDKLLRIYRSNLLNEFELYSMNISDFVLRSFGSNKILISFGTDKNEENKENVKTDESQNISYPLSNSISSLKIYNITNLTDINNNDEIPILIKKLNIMKKRGTNNYYNGNDINETHLAIRDITCFDVSQDLSIAAIGCQNGDLIIIKANDNLIDSAYNYIKVYQLNHNIKDEITNAAFTKYRGENYLIYSTKEEIYYYQVDENNKTPEQLEANIGVDPECLSMKQNENSFLMCTPTDGYLSEYGNFDKGKTVGFDGKKKFVSYYKEYFAFVVFDDTNYSFSVYDSKNQIFIFNNMNYYTTLAMCTDKESIFVLVEMEGNRKKTIFRYKEKDNKEKFDIFYKKNFFETAYSYAKSLNYDKKKISEILKRHAEHLYKKGEYEKSIDQYIQTINYLDPSYVIQKFLEGTRLDHLIKYLEALNKDKEMQKKCPKEEMKDYTALLLNCYIKQKKISKLKEFVDQKDINLQILETAIEVCKDTKETELALEIAEKSNMLEAKIQILMDLEKKYEESLKVMETEMNKVQKFHMFMRYGSKFFDEEREESMKVFKPLIEDIIKLKNGEELKDTPIEEQNELKEISYGLIVSIFISNEREKELEQILDLIMANDKDCPPLIIHRRLELYLEKIKNSSNDLTQDGYQMGEKIKEIITNPKYENKIDKHYLLMLFKIYKFNSGITELSKKMNLHQELLQLYMDNHNYDKIIEICKENEMDKVNYWIQALNYFINISTEGTKSFLEKYIKEILNEVSKNESFSPLLILAILKKSKNIQLVTVKDVLIDFLTKTQKTYKEDRAEAEGNNAKLEKLTQEEEELQQKAKLFSAVKCSLCNKPLSMPFLYFLCNHAYHAYCMNGEGSESNDCLICENKNNQLDQRLIQSQEVAKDHNSFQTELKGQTKKFNLFGKYLGKGIFEGIKK